MLVFALDELVVATRLRLAVYDKLVNDELELLEVARIDAVRLLLIVVALVSSVLSVCSKATSWFACF